MFANRYIRGVKVPCVAILIVAVIAIVAYGYYLRRTKSRDILETPILKKKPGFDGFDGWGLTHALLYAVLGYLYPGHHLQAFTVSVAWELIETFLGTSDIRVGGRRLQLIGDTDEEGRPTGKSDGYWYGKELDVIVNMGSYCIGSALADKYWPNDCKLFPVIPRA